MPDEKLPTTHEAVRALAFQQGAAALKLLTDTAGSKDQFLRRTAIEVIGSHPQACMLRPLILTALTDPSEYVVRAACNVVGKCKISEAHDLVLSVLASVSGSTRENALYALSSIWRDSDFLTVFRVFQRDVEKRVRKEAAWVLRDHAASENWRTLFDAFSVDGLPRHRQWACEIAAAFSDACDAEILPVLSRLNFDSSGHVRKAALRAIEVISHGNG
jgi:HEAT repeat protein